MTNDHPLLNGIRAAIDAAGVHSEHWGSLRRAAFPGTSWEGLKAWCAEHAIECEMGFTHASKAAEVQFRGRRKI